MTFKVIIHFVPEKIQENVISTGYAKTSEKSDDIFTCTRVEYLCNMLEMINIYIPT